MEKDSRRAGEERVTTLTQERLKIAVNTARLALAEIEKRDMVDAVQRYLQCLQTCRVLVTAKNAFQLEEEKLQNISLRYAAGLGAEMELLQQNNVCLKMKEEMETAEYEYFQSRLAFLQGVGQEKSNAFPFEVNVTSIEIEKYDFFLCLEKARAADSVFYSTHETLALAKKQWEVIQDLEDATAEERENAANELDRAEENCCLYERELHNRIFGVLEEFGLLIRRLELAERQAALARREQEVLKVRYTQGEICQLELDQALFQLHKAEDQVKLVKEFLFLQQILLKTSMGYDPSSFIMDLIP